MNRVIVLNHELVCTLEDQVKKLVKDGFNIISTNSTPLPKTGDYPSGGFQTVIIYKKTSMCIKTVQYTRNRDDHLLETTLAEILQVYSLVAPPVLSTTIVKADPVLHDHDGREEYLTTISFEYFVE